MATTWSIVNTEYLLSEGGQTNVVNRLHWQCIVADGEHFARAYGTVNVPTDDLSNFTAFADLTEAQVIEWAKAALGDEQVTRIEEGLASRVGEIVNPTTGSGLPW